MEEDKQPKLSKGQLKKLKQKEKAAKEANVDDDALLDSLQADTTAAKEDMKDDQKDSSA